MDDKPAVVNHELRLYRVCFFFSFQSNIPLLSSFILRPWNLLFYVESIKDKKLGKYCSTSSGVRSLFVMLCISFEG